MKTTITDKQLWPILKEKLQLNDYAQRVIIDVRVNDIVRVYVQYVGQASILELPWEDMLTIASNDNEME